MKSAMLRYSAVTDKLRFEVHSTPGRGQQKWYMKGSHAVEVARWTQAIAKSIELSRREAGSSQSQSGSESDTRSLRHLGTSLRTSISSRKAKDSGSSIHDSLEEASAKKPDVVEQDEDADDEDDNDEVDDFSSDAQSQRTPPFEGEFTLHGNSTAAQVELTAQLLSSLKLPADASDELQKVRAALEESAQAASRMVGEYVRMAAERDEWWREKLQRERERGALWEESLQIVVKEGEALEQELKNRSRMRRSSRDRSRRASTDLNRSTIRMRGSVQSGIFSPPPFRLEQPPGSKSVSGLPSVSPNEFPVGEDGGVHPYGASESSLPEPVQEDVEEMVDTDEEDEFFDAIESNALPNVIVPDALVKPPPSFDKELFVKLDQYEGYKNLRTKLPIDQDTRPPTSLWSVLKHSIGKDLTKISFPVFFNEPTSMLQRMVLLDWTLLLSARY